MKKLAAVSLFALLVVACNPDQSTPAGVVHPGEDKAGVGMRLQLVPEAPKAGSVRQAAAVVAQQETTPGTYLCICPPPVPGDVSQTRNCTCQVEGSTVPDVCGDGILNEQTEHCDPGDPKWCPTGYHCNTGNEKGADGVAYPACFNCIANP